MRVSQITKLMDKDDKIIADDYDAPIDHMNLYKGDVRGIKRDNPLNKMHVISISADNDTLLLLVTSKEVQA